MAEFNSGSNKIPSVLSAEAEAFVPSVNQSTSDLNKLPGYVTSCYPFVPDPSTNWSAGQRHNHVSMPFNQQLGRLYVTHVVGSMMNRPATRGLHHNMHSTPPIRHPLVIPAWKQKKSNRDVNLVSIGVQNESGFSRGVNPVGIIVKPKKTRTIVLADAANQTDFADEIANMQLAEKPHSLYFRGDWIASEGEGYTTDEDDVVENEEELEEEEDSDSGYSSPQHRRYGPSENSVTCTPIGKKPKRLKKKEESTCNDSSAVLSYSEVLKQGSTNVPPNSENANNLKESRQMQKRLRRQMIANKAAEEEYAEILVETEVLKQQTQQKQQKNNRSETSDNGQQTSTTANATTNNSSKKSQQPLMLADIFQPTVEVSGVQQRSKSTKCSNTSKSLAINPLDSSAPTIKRGKERENPRPKKPSALKKVILKEREEKKRSREMPDIALHEVELDSTANSESKGSSSVDFTENLPTPISAGDSPVSQTSPLPMSPLSSSPTPASNSSHVSAAVFQKIHSRRFREYCTHVLDSSIDECVTDLLRDLVRFQDRQYQKDPTKAKNKRRIVLGLREVTKHLKLGKIRCVVISPNLERIQSKGGLDDALNSIIKLCREQNLPIVFALGRRALGRACSKLVPVSVVGIFNHEGCDEKFKQLMALTQQARSQYEVMVKSFEEEIQQHINSRHTVETNGGDSACRPFPIAYSHLGHSRTPSACSTISFMSNISVSDQYSSLHQTTTQQTPADVQAESSEVKPSADREALDDIDEGHIADTEDEKPRNAKTPSEESNEQHVDDDKAKNVQDWLRRTTPNTNCSSLC
ncbi:DgyrCDS1118 [Dimorphilus gyrociliatus]|uniref:DgyrCDS1118 n=1 Tax=Dimorphilus gyrociliatus TaxID=2664684 RepID=A0A7I8V6I3_9ANNE|nr:DgyrCDS1118 [Dimorphilus gyrociliatus]